MSRSSTDPDATPGPDAILVGDVVKAHGLRGEVAVWTLSENPDRFRVGSRLLVGRDLESAVEMEVETSRPQPPDRLLVRFAGIYDRTGAEAMRGTRCFAAPRELPELPEDAFWEHDLVGLRVVDEEGRNLGVLSAVLSRLQQDLWEVKTPHGPVLLPASKGIVMSVDLPNRTITVAPPAGLF